VQQVAIVIFITRGEIHEVEEGTTKALIDNNVLHTNPSPTTAGQMNTLTLLHTLIMKLLYAITVASLDTLHPSAQNQNKTLINDFTTTFDSTRTCSNKLNTYQGTCIQ
jgi:hypothetical protein